MIEKIQNKFDEIFGAHFKMYRAPGRINIIGEHTDYNDGFVLPASISKEMIFAANKNNTKSTCNLYAFDLQEQHTFDLNDISPGKPLWANYIKGVVAEMQKAGKAPEGFDVVFGGNIPLGAGLSSSAALESGTATLLNDIFNLGFDKIQLIKIAQKAEHNYAGVMCGIMDQFASIAGKEKTVFLLDCRSLEYKYFQLELKNYQIILVDTQVKHSLASSAYNTRRQECETGVEIISKDTDGIVKLRDVSVDLIEFYKGKMPENIFNRCSYVVEENERVIKATKALADKNIEELGKLLYESHDGLSRKYEVSCDELDFLVDMARDKKYVAGARMMGGGFGGCTINLVLRDKVEKFKEIVFEAYTSKFHKEPAIFEIEIADGAGRF